MAKDEAKKVKPIDELLTALATAEKDFEKVLPPQVSVDKFIRVFRSAVAKEPKLIEVNRGLLFSELMKCAQDGLLPDGREAFIAVFKGKPVYIPMIAGLCKCARNSGEILSIDSQIVYKEDKYEAWIDEKGQHFKHTRARGERGKELCGYAYAITKDGGVYFEEMSPEQMDEVENVNKFSEDKRSPYQGPFREEMRRKAPLRRLLKHRVPSSADLEGALRHDDEMYTLPGREPGKAQDRPNRAAAAMGATGGADAGETKGNGEIAPPEPPHGSDDPASGHDEGPI